MFLTLTDLGQPMIIFCVRTLIQLFEFATFVVYLCVSMFRFLLHMRFSILTCSLLTPLLHFLPLPLLHLLPPFIASFNTYFHYFIDFLFHYFNHDLIRKSHIIFAHIISRVLYHLVGLVTKHEQGRPDWT